LGSCDNWLFGKESDITKLGHVCEGIRELLKTRYEDRSGEFCDWTGISDFIVFYNDLERTLHEQKVNSYDEETVKEEWRECPLNEGEAAIWWPEIAWTHKIPSEVWAFMIQEGKKLGVQQLLEKLILKWGAEDDAVFDHIEAKLGTSDSPVNYPRYPF
jgi:hypothetical protein